MNQAIVLLGLLVGTANASNMMCVPNPQHRVLTEQTGARYGLPPFMLSALVTKESAFCPRVVSKAGAMGLGQLMPATARDLGVKDPFNPVQNLDGAARYLRTQYLTFKSWPLALAAYNAGPGAVIKYGNSIPPYAETQDYVVRVLNIYSTYTANPAGTLRPTAAATAPTAPQSTKAATVKLNAPAPQISAGTPVLDPRIQYVTLQAVATPTPTLGRQPSAQITKTPKPPSTPQATQNPTRATAAASLKAPTAPNTTPPLTGMLTFIRSTSETAPEPFLSTIRAARPENQASVVTGGPVGEAATPATAQALPMAQPEAENTPAGSLTIIRARR